MSGELIKKVNELKRLIDEKSNKAFKKNATEYLNTDALDEMIEVQPDGYSEEKCEDTCCDVEQACDHEEEVHRHEEHRLAIKQELTEAIADEEAAVAFYLEKIRICKMHGLYELAELFKELAEDEMTHSAALRATLDIYGLSNFNKEIEGRREAFKILAKSVFEDFSGNEKNAEAAEKEAEKVRKEFDFAEEYAKNKAEYNKEKVAGVINDLIAGNKDLGTAMEILLKDGKKIAKAPKKGTKEEKNNKK